MNKDLEKDEVYKNRWYILAIVVMSPFMSCLDASIINIALPVMAKGFNVTMSSISYIVTSYLIGISATILIFGRISDIKGKSTVFKKGLLVFTIGSLFCGISPSLRILIFARIIQAIGAAMIMSTNQGIISQVFPGNERGRALGISGTFVALGTMLGPPLGGLIISVLTWHYIFLINIPFGILTYIFAVKILPKDEIKTNESIDIKGSILFAIFIILLFGSMIFGQKIGYKNKYILISFITSIIAFVVFYKTEISIKTPMLDLSIFENKVFSVNIFCAFISFATISFVNIIHPFYLQDVLKLSPANSGFIMMVYPITLSVIAPFSGYLSDKIGSKVLTLTGLIIACIGLFVMSYLKLNVTLTSIVVSISIVALGNGLFQSPNNSLVMSSVPKNKLGIAGSVNALVRNLGFVFGVAFSTTLLYNRMSFKLGYRVLGYVEGRPDVFIYAMQWSYIIASLLCLTAFIISLIEKVKNNNAV